MDIANKMFYIEALAAKQYAAGAYNSGEINLADYGYPREIAVIVSAGAFGTSATLDVAIKEADAAGGVYTAKKTFTQRTSAGVDTYVFRPSPGKQMLKIEATVGTAAVDFGVIIIGHHGRYKKPSSGTFSTT